MPSRKAASTTAAHRAEPLTAKVTSGKANMLTWLPRSLIV